MRRWIAMLLTLILFMTSGCGQQKQDSTTAETEVFDDQKDAEEIESKEDENMNRECAECIAKADLPERVKYPENYNDRDYGAWEKEKEERLSLVGNGEQDALFTYWKNSMPVFLAGQDKENHVYSPINTYLALAMLAEATDGETRNQILKVLGTNDVEEMKKEADAVWNANYVDDGTVSSLLGSSLWLSSDIEYDRQTIEGISEHNHSSIYSGTMGSQKYNELLHEWLNEQTKDLLKESADGVNFDPATILALATSIYYKAAWDNEFDEDMTENDTFHGSNEDEDVPFMYGFENGTYYSGDNFTAVTKSMMNSGKMWFVLPDEKISPEDLTSDAELTDLISGISSNKIRTERGLIKMRIPKFDITTDMSLLNGMKELGMYDVLSPEKADFSPVFRNGEATYKPYLSDAKHASRVKINEDGVEAAAYTVMMVAAGALPPSNEIEFTLDRPFLFVITGDTGAPLFTGIVNTIK